MRLHGIQRRLHRWAQDWARWFVFQYVGDGAAGSEFLLSVVTSYGPDLQRFFASKVPDPAEAQDLMQEVYLRILKVERPGLIRSPKAYLFRVAINIVHEHWLNRSARPAHVTFDEAFDESVSVESVRAGSKSSPEPLYISYAVDRR